MPNAKYQIGLWGANAAARPGGELHAIRLQDIRQRRVPWLWQGVVPSGALTIVAGDPGEGKSLLLIDWAARVTTGADWPDGRRGQLGSVLMFATEDQAESTVKSRFRAAAGDESKLLLGGVGAGGLPARGLALSSDLPQIDRLLTEIGDVRLLIIDPINASLGAVDTGRDNHLRSVLAPLISVAARHRVAIVGVTHLTKWGNRQALYRSLGGIRFQGMARAGWLVLRSTGGSPESRLMIPTKANLVRRPLAIAFTVTSAVGRRGVPVIKYDRFDVDLTADDALRATASERRGTVQVNAANFLRRLLQGQEPLPSARVFALAAAAGLSRRSVERAEQALPVLSFKSGNRWFKRWRA
jgi:putative DNA primase/helicase